MEHRDVVAPAQSQDAVELRGLRNEAARWQSAIGVAQWREDEVPVSVYADQIEAGEWFVLRDDDGILLGGLRLLWTDEAVWGVQPPTAVYVHHLVTRRSRIGTGLGAVLLDWAGGHSADAGREWLRLDCQESNIRLRAYYRSQGFLEVARTEFAEDSGWWPVMRFQRTTKCG